MKSLVKFTCLANQFLNSANFINGLRISIIFISLMVNANIANAQDEYPNTRFGLRGGVNLNSWTNEFPSIALDGFPIYPDSWKTTTGFHVGVYANIRLSELVALEPSATYTSKGTGMILNDAGISASSEVKSNYMDMGFMLKLYMSEGFNLFMGPQFSYHLNSSYDFTVDGTKIITGEDASNDISEYDMAAVLGLGYEFDSGLNLSVSGHLGFWTVDNLAILDTYNRNILFSIGYSF